jgi:hypothetical protein
MLSTTVTNTMASTITTGSPVYTVNAGSGSVFAVNGSAGYGAQNTLSVDQSGTIDLRGDRADIRVNGESIMETLQAIQARLNMLRPNPELEAEWDELRSLGEQYRKLEAELKEKTKMWKILKR